MVPFACTYRRTGKHRPTGTEQQAYPGCQQDYQRNCHNGSLLYDASKASDVLDARYVSMHTRNRG
jgi:hypothetical protein